MMSVKWTNDQLSAITTTDKGVIVSAAAGSGKTAVLIERVIRLLIDEKNQLPADKLLAVTFTNDAAAQMREKLSVALNKKIEEDPTNEWLQLQQMKLELAKISTINSFCLELVKNNIQQFDISNGVRIIDEAESFVMLEKALETVLEKHYDEDADNMSMLNNYFSIGNDNKLVDIITQLYNFSRSLPFKDSWFKNVIDSYNTDSANYKQWKTILFDNLNSEFSIIRNLFNEVCQLANSLKYYPKTKDIILKNDLELFEEIEKTIKLGEWDKIAEALNNISFDRFYGKPDKNAPKDNIIEKLVVEKIKGYRDNYKKSLESLAKLFSYSEAQITADLEASRKILESLVAIVNDLWDELWEQKVSKNAIDFSDVEILSIQLLCEETENGYKKSQLAKDIVNNNTYKIILIDEFQDVNNLQDLIFKMLSETEDDTIIGKNMFVVGDVKQSIYRFRQANPNIFIETRNDANKPQNAEKLKEIKLRTNFRSRDCVIDFVNFVFENIMSKKMGEVDYDINEALVLGADYNSKKLSTEILVIRKDEDIELDDETVDYSEPSVVAAKIRSMIDNGFPVYENSQERPCRQSDFCVLVRSRTVNKEYIEAFAQAGLSVQSEELTGYLRSREISILINMLNVIDNPMNDIAFASVLLSPIFMFSADDIAVIKNASSYRKLYPAFLTIIGETKDKELDIKSEELKYKCAGVVAKIKELRYYASSLTLEQLIRKIYDSTDFFLIASTYDDGAQKRANLRLLLEYAFSYDNSIGGGLTGFIRYINSVFNNGGDLKQSGVLNNYTDSVVIKTIHKSKGLEFPFVFLCRTATTFRNQRNDLSRQMLINLYNGIGFRLQEPEKYLKYTTLPYDAIKLVNETEMLSEEMRLLYVALTRAKEHLFITYSMGNNFQKKIESLAMSIARAGRVTPEIVRTANSMQDWLTMALLVYEGDSFLRDMCVAELKIPTHSTNASIEFIEGADILSRQDLSEQQSSESIKETKPSEKIIAEIEHYLDFKYDEKYSQTQSKLSVSEVAKKDTSLEYFYQLPRLDEEVGKLTAAEKGTATHSFMELADYDKAQQDVESEIRRLISIGLLSEKQGEAIKTKSITAFFSSKFYARMKKSKNLMREKQFLVMISDLKLDLDELSVYNGTDGMLQGIADCVFEEDDGYVLVDYKTDNVKSFDELKEHYSLQLMLYKAAFDLILDKPVKSSYIYSFKLEQGAEITLYEIAK